MIQRADIPGLGLKWPASWDALVEAHGCPTCAGRVLHISGGVARGYTQRNSRPFARKTRRKFLDFGWTDTELPAGPMYNDGQGNMPKGRGTRRDRDMVEALASLREYYMARASTERRRPRIKDQKARVSFEQPIHDGVARRICSMDKSDGRFACNLATSLIDKLGWKRAAKWARSKHNGKDARQRKASQV